MKMFPHERSLVKKMEGKPFVILGVNGDDSDSTETLKKKNEAQHITWRSFRSNRGGNGGTIAEDWALEGWPTLYVIDPKGVIRYKWLGNPGDQVIDNAIEELVKAAVSGDGKKSSN